MSEVLRPYVSRLVIDWLRETPGVAHRRVEGTLVFADISGFTNLTERLARRGKAGAEEMGDLLNDTFEQLLVPAYEYGAALIKWGGDAVLLHFEGDDHAARSCRSAVEMQRVIRRIGRLRTTAGGVRLRMSVGVHTGELDFFLVGAQHRELVVVGPAASEVALMEQQADAGEIVVSLSTAALLDSAHMGDPKGDGVLLVAPPVAQPMPSQRDGAATLPDLTVTVPPPIRLHLETGTADSEHRQVTTAFVHFSGTDALLADAGPDAVAAALGDLIDAAQSAAERCGVTFLGTDVGRDGGKVILLAGAPVSHGDADQRMLGALRAILDSPVDLPLRAGVTHGRIFTGDFGPAYRRTYSVVGDTVNLAARLMAHAAPGQLVALPSVVDRARTSYDVTPLPPFRVKGKSEPIDAFAVGAAVSDVEVATSHSGPFVGRETEVVALLDAFQQASAGTGRYVDLLGSAGMGKSRLVEEAFAQIPHVRRVTVCCDVYESGTPYAQVRRLLRSLLALNGRTDEAAGREFREAVAAVAPQLLPWLPLLASAVNLPAESTPEVDALEERFRRPRLARSVAELLSALLPEPTVLVIEDGQLMDDASHEVITAVIDVLPDRPWLLVTTRRPNAAREVADPVEHVIPMWLTPLADDDAERLLHALTDDDPLSPHEIDAIRRHADGNPLYLRELLAARRQLGSLDALPDTLEGVIAAQIDALPPVPRRLLRTAAILGVRSDSSLLRDLLGDDAADADDAAWATLEPFLITEPDGSRRFRQPLVREAAYETLPYRRRRLLHGQVGAALERRRDVSSVEQLSALSFHFYSAQQNEPALRYSRQAADRAREQYANVEAEQFYRRALESAQRLQVAGPEVAELAELLGEVCFHLGEFAKADAAYRLARRHLDDDAVAIARLRMRMARVSIRAGRYPQALRSLTRGMRELDGVQGPEARAWAARLCSQYAFVRHMQGRERDTLRWAEQAAETARLVEARDALAQAYQLLDWANVSLGRFDTEHYAHEALAIWEEEGDLHWQAMVLNHLGMRAYFQGEWEQALTMYERSRQALERIGDQWNAAIAAANIAEIFVDQGRLAEAETMARQALRVFRASDTPGYVAMANEMLGRIAARDGAYPEAYAQLESAQEGYLGDGELPEALQIDARIAECLVFEGRAEESMRRADDALVRATAGDGLAAVVPLLHRVRGYAFAQLGERMASREALEAGVAAARQRNARHDVALTLDAIIRIARHEGSPLDAAYVVERDELFALLGIASAPAVPLPGESWQIPAPRATTLSASVEPA